MNLHICADKETAQLVGSVVQVNQTTGVSHDGCSAMEKMIVAMALTNFPTTVPSAHQKLTLSAATTDAFQSKYIVFLYFKI